MTLEKLDKMETYNEVQAKLLLSRLGLDYRPFNELFEEDDGVYTKVKNFNFVVNLLQLARGVIDFHLVYKK
jgi:hypothetical protein